MSNGSVGIGTSSPTTPLHVVGTTYLNGSVGIGTSGPNFPLEVASTATSTVSTNGWMYPYNGSPYALNGYYTVSAKMGGVWSTGGFIASSDARIKTNIQTINDADSLLKLRSLQPKRYEYIDKVSKGDQTVYGFIAQEVQKILPYAVSTKQELVPNIYKGARAEATFQGILLTFESQHDITGTCKLKLYDISNNNMDTNVLGVVSSNQLLVSDSFRDVNGQVTSEVFVYGAYVDDFHVLDKDAIFTVAVSALQQVDQHVTELQCKITKLEERLTTLEITNK